MSEEGRYIIEFHQLGNAVKVSAVDPATMTEVSIVGPTNVSELMLRRNAVRKLEYVLDKRQPAQSGRGGLIG